MTYSYAQKHHKNYNRCYKNYPMKVVECCLKMNIAKTKVMVVDKTPINMNNVLIENILRVLGTTLQPQGKTPGQRDTTKNHGRLGGIRQTPGYLQNQHCHQPEERGVQLLCAASYDIWCRDLTLTKQAQNKIAATQTKMERSMLNITYKDRRTNIWVRERTKLIDIIYTVGKMKWSWAGHINRLKDDRWTSRVTMHLETIWQENTTMETSQAVERRPGQIRERHDMAEDSTRQGHLETTCWGLRPTTGHDGCLMMLELKRFILQQTFCYSENMHTTWLLRYN